MYAHVMEHNIKRQFFIKSLLIWSTSSTPTKRTPNKHILMTHCVDIVCENTIPKLSLEMAPAWNFF